MSRYLVILSLVVLTFVGCQRIKPKPLAERLLDTMIQRCKVMVPKEEHARCENPPGNTVRDAMNALHEMMVSQVSALSIDGTCSKHGLVSHLQPKNLIRHKERHLPTVVSGRRLGQSDPLRLVGEVVTKPPRFLEGTVSNRGSECSERTGGILLFQA